MAITPIKGTATIGATEWSLTNGVNGSASLTANAGPSYLTITVDPVAAPVAAGDQFRMRIYAKANGGTQRLLSSFDVLGAVGKQWTIGVVGSLEGWEVTLQKIQGNDRVLPWTIEVDDGGAAGVTSLTAAIAAVPAAVWATVLDGNAAAFAQTASQIFNIIVSALVAPGTGLAADGSVTIKDTGNTKSRITGTIAAGVRSLLSLDGR